MTDDEVAEDLLIFASEIMDIADCLARGMADASDVRDGDRLHARALSFWDEYYKRDLKLIGEHQLWWVAQVLELWPEIKARKTEFVS